MKYEKISRQCKRSKRKILLQAMDFGWDKMLENSCKMRTTKTGQARISRPSTDMAPGRRRRLCHVTASSSTFARRHTNNAIKRHAVITINTTSSTRRCRRYESDSDARRANVSPRRNSPPTAAGPTHGNGAIIARIASHKSTPNDQSSVRSTTGCQAPRERSPRAMTKMAMPRYTYISSILLCWRVFAG